MQLLLNLVLLMLLRMLLQKLLLLDLDQVGLGYVFIKAEK